MCFKRINIPTDTSLEMFYNTLKPFFEVPRMFCLRTEEIKFLTHRVQVGMNRVRSFDHFFIISGSNVVVSGWWYLFFSYFGLIKPETFRAIQERNIQNSTKCFLKQFSAFCNVKKLHYIIIFELFLNK